MSHPASEKAVEGPVVQGAGGPSPLGKRPSVKRLQHEIGKINRSLAALEDEERSLPDSEIYRSGDKLYYQWRESGKTYRTSNIQRCQLAEVVEVTDVVCKIRVKLRDRAEMMAEIARIEAEGADERYQVAKAALVGHDRNHDREREEAEDKERREREKREEEKKRSRRKKR